MTIKKLMPLAFVAILVLSAVMVFRVPLAFATDGPYIGVSPPHISNKKSPDTFTVKINVSSTSPFVGYQYYLYWDRTYINATGMTETPPAAWTPFSTGTGLKWNYNATHGRVQRAVLDTQSPLVTVTGTFTVATITFKVIQDSSPPKVIPLTLTQTKISNANGENIVHTGYNGDVTVIPEFPTFLIIPLFIALTLVAVVLGKKNLLRTRRSSFVAS